MVSSSLFCCPQLSRRKFPSSFSPFSFLGLVSSSVDVSVRFVLLFDLMAVVFPCVFLVFASRFFWCFCRGLGFSLLPLCPSFSQVCALVCLVLGGPVHVSSFLSIAGWCPVLDGFSSVGLRLLYFLLWFRPLLLFVQLSVLMRSTRDGLVLCLFVLVMVQCFSALLAALLILGGDSFLSVRFGCSFCLVFLYSMRLVLMFPLFTAAQYVGLVLFFLPHRMLLFGVTLWVSPRMRWGILLFFFAFFGYVTGPVYAVLLFCSLIF